MREPRRCDVLIIGGGPAAAALAHQLMLIGLDVEVIASPRDRRARPPEILAPNSMPALFALDLVDALCESEGVARPCWGVLRRWGTSHQTIHDYLAEPGSRAFIVDRVRFDTFLRERALSVGARWREGEKFLDLVRHRKGWRVELCRGEVEARFVVDATGRAAALARRLGARQVRASRRVAVSYREERCEAVATGWLEVEAARDGWWYSISNDDRTVAATFVSTPRALRRDRRRVEALGKASYVCDASSVSLDRCTGDGWLAIGDAAATFDPIASQGLANSLAAAAAAAAAIPAALEHDDGALHLYDRQVRATWLNSVSGACDVYRSEHRWSNDLFWSEAAARPFAFDNPSPGKSGARAD